VGIFQKSEDGFFWLALRLVFVLPSHVVLLGLLEHLLLTKLQLVNRNWELANVKSKKVGGNRGGCTIT
jgi:hypothetical protein